MNISAPATLTGLAVGDALGVQFETLPFGSDALRDWDGSYGPSVYHKLKAGQWSDDTMMAKILAESLNVEGTYSPADVARRYLRWLEGGDKRGMGKTTEAALTRLKRGLPWTQSGIPEAEGNGTAMRVAPIGLFFSSNIQAVIEMARIDARITHASLEAEAGSIAVATAVAMLAEGRDRDSLLYKVLECTPQSRVAVGMREVLHFCETVLWPNGPLGPEDVLALPKKLSEMGTSAHVVHTVPAAFMAFMATESYQDAVESAVRAGGDTDTTAAVTGALAGTYYGRDQVAPYLPELESSDLLANLETGFAHSGVCL